jgi:soluble lytic murein transglycosylase-like protein
MKNPALIAAAGLLAFGAWRLNQNAQSLTIEDVSGAVQDFGDNIVNKTVNALGLWRAPAQYAGLIAQAEAAQGIPATMLERLLYQECRYRNDIITGAVRSSVGAMGIAQFMPATAAELGIDPLDPKQAIPAAAKYLAGLYRKFGNWSEALASYNWGQGNVQRKGLANAPRETRNYYTQILADVNSVGGTNYA